MRLAVLVCAALVLGGCASVSQVSPAIQGMENVEIGPGPGGHQYVNKVSYQFDGAVVAGEALPICVVQNVQNRQVTLEDSSSQRFVPYVGVVSKESAREVGGGQVITYVSEDKQTVLANGATAYQHTSMMLSIDQSVRFSLSAKSSQEGLSVVFTEIDQAQIDTGAIANTGYKKLGAWPAQNPEMAIERLNAIATNIADCVKSQ